MRVLPLYVLFGGWLSLPALADDAEGWMNRLATAEQKQSYVGAFVYERNGNFSSHAVWQVSEEGHVRERLLQLDGPAVEVLRVDGEAECASGGLGVQTEARPAQNLDVKALSQWYDFRMIGDSRVADRPAVALAVIPRDQHRYGFELHLDRETSVPLKSLLLNEKGQLLERFQFVRFTPDPAVAAAGVKPRSACKQVVRSSAEQDEQVSAAWRSDWVPAGFELLDSSVRASPATDVPVAWLSYGDGLARFSVFVEPLKGAVVDDARSQMGPTVAVSKRITAADGDVMVTVIGEIPLGTAERVALSMRASSEAPR